MTLPAGRQAGRRDGDTTTGLTITGLEELLGRILRVDDQTYERWVYIYGLTNADGAIWYVGSTKHLGHRLLAHLMGQTIDTGPTIATMRAAGTLPTTRVLDLTIAPERYAHEGYWIGQHPECINTTRYHDLAAKVRACRECYRSASASTLAAAG